MKMLRYIPVLLLAAVASQGQYPGQYPPGQYPGRYPYPGGPVPRIPGQTGPNGRGRGGQPAPESRGKRSSSEAKLLTTTAGILRRATSSQLVIQADDHRVIWYRLAPQVKVQKDGKDADLKDFAQGDYVSVDSNADDESVLTAVSVTWKKAATRDDLAEASKDWDLPRIETAARAAAKSAAPTNNSASSPPHQDGDERPVLRRKDPEPPPKEETTPEPQPTPVANAPAGPVAPKAPVAPKTEEADNAPPPTTVRPPDPKPDPDDPGKPVLRRGTPAPRHAISDQSVTEAAAAPAAPPPPVTNSAAPPQSGAPAGIPLSDDPIIAKAREAAFSFTETLPNYMVQQITTRYETEHPKQGWAARDIVTADVTVQDGRESYRNIKVGNKSTDRPMDQIEGTRSTGEFSTLLEQLLDNAATRFKSGGTDTIHNRSAYVYSFEIPREASRWRIEAPSQLYYPAIKGSVWIDKETSRVLRIEQQGKPMPALFPFDTIETTADYDFIRLGTAGPFLLPVEAEVLSCQRGTSICNRNKIEFRNYRKFEAESNITFDK
jgi:hypothetical protein